MDNDISALERKCLLRHHIPAIPIPTLRHLLSEDFPETFGHYSKQNYGSEFRLKITFLVIYGDPSLKRGLHTTSCRSLLWGSFWGLPIDSRNTSHYRNSQFNMNILNEILNI